MNLTVAGTSEAVLMVEAGAKEVSEEVMLGGILFAHEEVKKIVEFINGIVAEIGKPKKEFPLQLPGDDVKQAVREYAYDKVEWMFETFDRAERNAREEQVKAEVSEHFAEPFEGRETEVGDALYAIEKEVMRRHIIDKGVRPDGRKLTEVRPIWCEVGVLPRTHGSGVFTRGQTQVMTVATLAPVSDCLLYTSAKAAGVQIIVAINKIDKVGANIERIKQQLTEYELVCEEWGGDTIMVPVSAVTGEGVDQLLEMILLVAEVQDYRANPNRKARGIIIEARLDKGRGPVATVLVKNGTLRVSDTIVAGTAYGRVRAMVNDRGERVKEAGPSQPVEVIGFNDVPEAGDMILSLIHI